ncbi:MAG TPA: hypothetical protein VNZ22_18660, partial [Bacillota bacterium]|nr:hypothetical protein [Bacillota bacterium]
MKPLACLFVCTAAIASANAQGTTEAVLNYGPVPGSSLATGPMDGTVGWTFKPLVDIDVFALGSVAQSLLAQSPLSIGVWTAAGQLVASNAVTSSSTQINQSRYESITPVHLAAGQVYHIG